MCDEKGFNSPLDLLEDPESLEEMSQEELDLILEESVNNDQVWVNYKGLFDNKISPG